jgi:hypothetical protein
MYSMPQVLPAGDATMIAANARITELDIRRAERAANKATAEYSAHERYCSLWRRDLTCTTCAQLWAFAEQTRRFWESMLAEYQRQQTPAERVAAEGIA